MTDDLRFQLYRRMIITAWPDSAERTARLEAVELRIARLERDREK